MLTNCDLSIQSMSDVKEENISEEASYREVISFCMENN